MNFARLALLVAMIAPAAPASAFQSQLEAYYEQANDLLISQHRRGLEISLFGGWEASPAMQGMLDGYELDGNGKWLDHFVELSEQFLDFRADAKKVVNFDGTIKPQWYRAERSNIFNYPPGKTYTDEQKAEILRERGWKTAHFGDINNDGLYLWPMLRFAAMVRETPALQAQYGAHAQRLVKASIETVASHEGEWTELAPGRGYYHFPTNSPFYLDGVEMPPNEAAPFGTALVFLYEATGDRQYLDRAHAMVRNWLTYVEFGPDGMSQPYSTGAWFEGWNESNSPSRNTTSMPANKNPESLHKAGLTVSLLSRLAPNVDDPDVDRYLDGFRRILAKTDTFEGGQISFFPTTIDGKAPEDSFHVNNPAVMRGMAEITDPVSWRKMYLMATAEVARSQTRIGNITVLKLNPPDGVDRHPVMKLETVEIKPLKIGEKPVPGSCLYKAKSDAAVYITYRRKLKKHNRLYLSPAEGIRGIRLQIDKKDGQHHGNAYLTAGDCVNWTWVEGADPKFSQPQAATEEAISLEMYRIVEEDSPSPN